MHGEMVKVTKGGSVGQFRLLTDFRTYSGHPLVEEWQGTVLCGYIDCVIVIVLVGLSGGVEEFVSLSGGGAGPVTKVK